MHYPLTRHLVALRGIILVEPRPGHAEGEHGRRRQLRDPPGAPDVACGDERGRSLVAVAARDAILGWDGRRCYGYCCRHFYFYDH